MKAIIGLDVGTKRTGVARAPLDVSLASPLTTLDSSDDTSDTLLELLNKEEAVAVVVGLPRGIDGQETAQTTTTRTFARQLEQESGLSVYLQDEALTSVKAREELSNKKSGHDKADVDALAATYILQDFLDSQQQALKEIRERESK